MDNTLVLKAVGIDQYAFYVNFRYVLPLRSLFIVIYIVSVKIMHTLSIRNKKAGKIEVHKLRIKNQIARRLQMRLFFLLV